MNNILQISIFDYTDIENLEDWEKLKNCNITFESLKNGANKKKRNILT